MNQEQGRAKQAAKRLERLRHAPGTLVDFQFTVTAQCPATRQQVVVSGPTRYDPEMPNPLRRDDGTLRPPEEVNDPAQPWNAPSVSLSGWGYETDGGTSFNGITLHIYHCPACGGSHVMEAD